MPLSKQALLVENNTNFPNNNAGYITPELLRQFNTDMIDAMQLTQSMSEYAELAGGNNFTGNQTIVGDLNVSGVISASVLYVQTETSSVIYSSGSNQFGDELTDIQTLSGSVKVQGSLTVNGVAVLTSSVSVDTGSLVTTASFNAYTQSTNLRLNSLETNSASVNVSISNLNTTTASLNTSITNINQFTQSQAALNGTFATTGSNTFTGNQIIDRASKLYTNGIYWTDPTAGFNNLEIINQGGGNLDFASLNGGKVRIVNTPLVLTGSALTSSNDISTSANIYAANLTGSATIPAGTISSSAQITSLGFVSSSVTASSLITASFSGNTLTFTKGDASTFGVVIPDVSGSTINTSSFATTGSNNFFGNQNISGGVRIGDQSGGTDFVYIDKDGVNLYNDTQTSINFNAPSVFFQTTGIFSLQNQIGGVGSGSMNISAKGADVNISGSQLNLQGSQLNIQGNVLTKGAIQAASYNENIPQFYGPVVFQGVGTASVAYDQFVNGGNYDSLHIESNLNAGTIFQDYNGSQVNTWLSIPTNTGSNPAPIFTRGLDVSGSLYVSGNIYANNLTGSSINTGSFATTGSNTFTGNQTLNKDTILFFGPSGPGNGNIRNNSFDNITLFSTTGGYQQKNFTSGSILIQQNTNGLIEIANIVDGITISGSSTQIQDVDFIPFSASLNTRILAVTGSSINTGSFATTGSNTFVGNQTISGSELLVLGEYPQIRMQKNAEGSGSQYPGLTVVVDSKEYQAGGVYGGFGVYDAGQDPLKTIMAMAANSYTRFNPEMVGGLFGGGLNDAGDDSAIVLRTGSATMYVEKPTIFRYNANIQGSLTASLAQGYVWAGGAGNISTLVATSSFGGGGSLPAGVLSSSVTNFVDYSASVDSRINGIVTGTGFATTGSNTFNGTQNISGSIVMNSANDGEKFLIYRNGQPTQNWEFGITSPGNSFLKTRNRTWVQNDGVDGEKMIHYLPTNFVAGIYTDTPNVLDITGSVNISANLTASLQEGYVWVGNNSGRTSLVATSSFGGGGGTTYVNPTLNPYSGSLILVANTFTSSSFAHISASANGQVNLVFKNNNNTASTTISGSNNIFTNPTAAGAGFKRFIGGSGNLMLNPAAVNQISASQTFPITTNFNIHTAGSISTRAAVSASAWTINSNMLIGNIQVGNATGNAEKLLGTLNISNNQIGNLLSIQANKTAISASTSINSNALIGGSTVLVMASSSIGYFTNVGNAVITNGFENAGAAVGNNQLSVQQNWFGAAIINVSGSDAGGLTNPRTIANNYLFSGYQTTGTEAIANLSLNGSGSSMVSTMAMGHELGITGSNGVDTNIGGLTPGIGAGSAFFGRWNSQSGNRARTAETVFAVGTGTSTSLTKTGFLIDSGSNTFIEGTLNVSGSTSLTGSLTITGSASVNGSQLVKSNQTGSFIMNLQPTANPLEFFYDLGNGGVNQYTLVAPTSLTGSVIITSGSQLTLPTGSNQQAGTAVLDGGNPGTVTVSNSLVTSNSIIMLTKQTLTNAHMVAVTAKSAGSFTITSNGNGDTDTVGWFIINNS